MAGSSTQPGSRNRPQRRYNDRLPGAKVNHVFVVQQGKWLASSGATFQNHLAFFGPGRPDWAKPRWKLGPARLTTHW